MLRQEEKAIVYPENVNTIRKIIAEHGVKSVYIPGTKSYLQKDIRRGNQNVTPGAVLLREKIIEQLVSGDLRQNLEDMNVVSNAEEFEEIRDEIMKNYTFDNRENGLVRKIGNSNDRVSNILYDGMHDFRNEVDTWNRLNPSNKLNLVEIAPTHYNFDNEYETERFVMN